MSDEIVLVNIAENGVATITLNRPEVNNAYNGEMVLALIEAVERLAQDASARVVVIRGAGPHFQAGADLAWVRGNREKTWEENLQISRNTTLAIQGLTTLTKPTVALVHGGCFGGGVGIASACDIVIAAEDAIFSITEARWGLMAAPIYPQLISRLGPGRTRRYSLTCERFDGRRAFEIGLVDEVTSATALDETAAPIIDALLHCPPGAVAASKASILKYSQLYFSAMEIEEMATPHAAIRLYDEAEEGLQSFLQKRKPQWYPGS
ncbi:MAG: enoyl-CoA hydratase/isomerase family protein [Gammaproteobacteria bacterium]|nr:enoyl-CoA hydratase/isomerase family protein [Gammaproteobacteria bacterium]